MASPIPWQWSPTRLRLVCIPPNHKPLGCFEEPPIPLARLRCCNGPHRGLNSNHQRGCSHSILGGSKRTEAVNLAFLASIRLSSRPCAFRIDHRCEQHPTGYSPLLLSRHGPRKETRRMDNRFDALVSCRLECLRFKRVLWLVGLSALQANDWPEGFMVGGPELGEVVYAEASSHTPV